MSSLPGVAEARRLYALNEIPIDELDELYVPRPDQPMQRLLTLLRGRSRQQKFFLVGQHGCGKTTELNRLQVDVSQDYTVVRCGHDELRGMDDPVDVEFVFLLLRTFLSATERLDPELHERVTRGLYARLGSAQIQDLDLKLSMMGLRLSATRQPRDIPREAAVREEFKIFKSELLSLVNAAIGGIADFTAKPVLLIIDDMEKLEYAQVRKLFSGYAQLLSSLPCAVICTAPLGLMFDGELLIRLRDDFHDVSLTNVPIFGGETKSIGVAIHFLQEVVRLRVEIPSTDPRAFPYAVLVYASGGNLRQCLRLVGSAVLFADQDGAQAVDERHARQVIQNGERDYRRILTLEEREILKDVMITKEYHSGMPLALLGNLSVLEYWYPDLPTWYSVNPLAHCLIGLPSLTEFFKDEG